MNFGVAVFVFGCGLVQIAVNNVGLAIIDFGCAGLNVFAGMFLLDWCFNKKEKVK